MKRTALLILSFVLLASCKTEMPKELDVSKNLDQLVIHYPSSWTCEDGLGGGATLSNKNGTMGIPFNVQVYDGAKANDVNSIPDILSIFQKPTPGGKMWIKTLSGHQCIWAESELMGQKMLYVYIPLDNAIIAIQTLARQNDKGEAVTKEDLRIAEMIVENVEIK
jgi:hypothetical protein